MATTGSSMPSSVKRKTDIDWGGAREGAGRKKKKKSSSAPQQPPGPSTQSHSAGNSPTSSSQPAVAAVGFFAPRMGSSKPSLGVQVDAGPRGARIAPEQGALIVYCGIYDFLTIPHS
jgi:hypothetical protein